jgi:hypothetical protein
LELELLPTASVRLLSDVSLFVSLAPAKTTGRNNMENKSEVSLDFIGFNPLDYLGFKQEQKHAVFPFQI